MKTKLITHEEDSIIGYNNVFYTALENINNNSCFELYCGPEVLKLISNTNFSSFIKNCCDKIRHQGSFIITCPDINNIALAYVYKNIGENDLCDLLAGSFGFYNCRMVEDEIKANGLKIHSMSIIDNNFVIRGIRE